MHQLTAIFCRHTFLIFFNCFRSLIVMPCAARTFHSFVPQSLHSLHNLCLHGHWPARFFLQGGKRWPAMPIVRARLVPRQAPLANPTRLARARMVSPFISDSIVRAISKCFTIVHNRIKSFIIVYNRSQPLTFTWTL